MAVYRSVCGDLHDRRCASLAAANASGAQKEAPDNRVGTRVATGNNAKPLHRRVRILAEANAIHGRVVSAGSDHGDIPSGHIRRLHQLNVSVCSQHIDAVEITRIRGSDQHVR